MIHIAIVEDDLTWGQQLQSYIDTYGSSNQYHFSVSLFQDGEDLLQNYHAQYDIIFLDVQMRFLDGMTTAKLIRQQDSEVAILFITNMAQYAIRGYEVDAMDYMLKPVSYTTFCQRMGRVLSRLKQRVKHFITVPIKGGAMKLAVDDILYVESQGHRLIYYTKNGNYISSGTITEAESTLEGMHFFRSNKGYLLNLECVDGIQDNCAIINGQKLQISRSRKAAFLDALTRHIGGAL